MAKKLGWFFHQCHGLFFPPVYGLFFRPLHGLFFSPSTDCFSASGTFSSTDCFSARGGVFSTDFFRRGATTNDLAGSVPLTALYIGLAKSFPALVGRYPMSLSQPFSTSHVRLSFSAFRLTSRVLQGLNLLLQCLQHFLRVFHGSQVPNSIFAILLTAVYLSNLAIDDSS